MINPIITAKFDRIAERLGISDKVTIIRRGRRLKCRTKKSF